MSNCNPTSTECNIVNLCTSNTMQDQVLCNSNPQCQFNKNGACAISKLFDNYNNDVRNQYIKQCNLYNNNETMCNSQTVGASTGKSYKQCTFIPSIIDGHIPQEYEINDSIIDLEYSKFSNTKMNYTL